MAGYLPGALGSNCSTGMAFPPAVKVLVVFLIGTGSAAERPTATARTTKLNRNRAKRVVRVIAAPCLWDDCHLLWCSALPPLTRQGGADFFCDAKGILQSCQ